jgi:LmbE family N-acetylglucosaminyl deacetylase
LLALVLPPERRAPLKLLCLGAHADDIEIGCGGTIVRLAAEVPDLIVQWIVFSGVGSRAAEARNSAATFLEAEKKIEVLGSVTGISRSRTPTSKITSRLSNAISIRR